MTEPNHHIPEALLASYAQGTVAWPFAMTIACHISQCDECRAALESHQSLGGVLLDDLPATPVSDDMAANLFAALDGAERQATPPRPRGIFPAPLADHLGPKGPKWHALGGGVKQALISADAEGSLRLLQIPGGAGVPEHGHSGMEMTLVLQGGFSDADGQFGVGDLEVTDQFVDHKPTAWPGQTCICLAATNAPLRFHGLLPRLLQPLFRI